MSLDGAGGLEAVETFDVACPYCGETVRIFLERDLRGEMVQDCEVCCHPWRLRVAADGSGLRVEVSTLDE